MAHGLVRVGEKRVLPPPRRAGLLGGMGSVSGGDPGGGFMSGARLVVWVLEDFEDNDISDYEGDISEFQVADDNVYEGNYCLKTDVGSGGLIYRPDIDVSWGHRFTVRFWTPSIIQVPVIEGFVFCYSVGVGNYQVRVDFNTLLLSLIREAPAPVTLDSANIGVPPWETHQEIVIDWTDAGVITINGFGVELTATDTTFEEGHIGWAAIDTCSQGAVRMDYVTYRALL